MCHPLPAVTSNPLIKDSVKDGVLTIGMVGKNVMNDVARTLTYTVILHHQT